MVKVGFICEGHTEFVLLQSALFQQILNELNITAVKIINAEGCGNLLPHNISAYIQSLENASAEMIVILTDLDTDNCITQTKQRISARPQDVVIVAAKQLEAWFLACNPTMQRMLADDEFNFEFPEKEIAPFVTINNILLAATGQGIGRNNGGKIKLIHRLLNNGLDLREAAAHPNCPSAKYFIDKLTEIGTIA